MADEEDNYEPVANLVFKITMIFAFFAIASAAAILVWTRL